MYTYFTYVLKKSFRNKFYAMVALIAIVSISACKKEEVDNTAYAAISVVNGSPTVSTYDIYLGATKLNSVAIPSGGSVGYSQRVTASYDLKFTTAGRVESLYTKSIGLTTNAYQTFFLVGGTAALDGFFTIDDLSAVSATHAYVRFVHLSPDAQAMDLFVKGGSSLIANKGFKTASAFTPITAGTYTFEVKETTGGAVKATTESVILGANVYYTVFVKGLVTPAAGGLELPLSAQVIVNSKL